MKVDHGKEAGASGEEKNGESKDLRARQVATTDWQDSQCSPLMRV